MHNRVLHALTLAAVLAASATAATHDDWNDVVELPQGARIEVVHGALQKTEGLLAAVSVDSLSIQTESGPRTLDRADVHRVTVKSGSRKRRVLIGTIVGAASGAAFAAVGGAIDSFEVRTGIVMAAAVTGGAGIGAAVGAAASGSRTVYRSPK
jgi:hypothetical protein